ncbi:MAG TPA: tetratricopeptide repeat protein, partial [Myxococcales bacterium]|nr:tetratricopeptide repeat protein [Myxococcales bacterium]
RTELLYELADLCDDSLADTAGAVRAYQELLSQAPEDRAVLKSLQRLYERTKDSMGLEDVLARDLELARKAGAGPEEVSALALRLGLLKLERPEEGAAALALLSEVLRLEPHQPHALAALGKLASTPGPLQQEAARLATPAMGKLGDFQAVVQVLEAQLSTQAGPAERAAILRRLADLHEGPLDDPDLAFLAVTRALRETPQDASLLLRSVALAEVTGAQEDLEALLEDLATSQPPGAARAGLWRALARSLDGRSQPAEALRAWSQVRMESPGDPEATGRLAASLEQAGRFKELTDLVQQQVDSASPEQRPAALARLAAAREKAGLLEEAVSTLHSLFALTQGADALRSLERILGKLGRHPERAEVLKRLTALATAGGDPKERVDLLLRQARAQLQAGQPELAVATLADLLAASPDEPRAIPELITLAAEPRARATALDLLESAFKDPKQGFQRVAILELLVEARSPEDGRALRAELAALHEALGDLRQAFAWRLRLVVEDPGEQGPRVEAERLARVAHLEEELAGAYQDLLERQPPVELHLDAADRALPILEGVLEGAGRFDRLSELLAGRIRAAAAAGDEMLELDLTVREARLRLRALKDGAAALSLLASVLQRRDGLPEAVEVLEEIMRSEGPGPAAHQAAEMLERHYRSAGGAPQRLVEALEVRARAAAGQWAPGDEQAGLLLQIADLHEKTLKAPAAAFDAVARLLRLQPDDGAALERLLALAGPANAEPALEALLAEIAPRAAKPETRMAILRPLARLRERLGDPAGALEGWQELLAFRPDDVEALASASTLLEGASRWDELLVVLERRLTLARDDDERAALLGRIGSLRADALGDAEGAHGVLWSLLRLRPGDRRTLAQLDPICQELEKWPELADVLERRLRVEPDRRVELLLRLAQVRRTRLGDPAGALPLLGEALQAQPGHAGALAELERLVKEGPGTAPAEDLLLDTYRRAGDLPRLIPLLEACSERAQEPERRRALWQELADLRLKQERDPERAFLALARAYRESPADAALRAKLIEVAQAADAREELVALLEEVVGRLAPPDAAEVSLVIAGLCEGPGGDPEQAVALYRRAIELSPRGAARVWPRLDRALESLERWEELLPVVEAQERAAGDGPERVGLLLRIATIAAEHLALPERA